MYNLSDADSPKSVPFDGAVSMTKIVQGIKTPKTSKQ